MEFFTKSKIYITLFSAAFILIGLALIIWPAFSVSVLCYLIGAVLLLLGLVKTIGFFVKKAKDIPEFKYDVALGVFLVFCGILFLSRPGSIVNIVQTFVGIGILADAAVKIQTSIDARLINASNWWVILIFAGVAVIAGALLVFNPFGTAYAVTVLIGITFLADGLLNICTNFFISKFLKMSSGETTVYFNPSDKR